MASRASAGSSPKEAAVPFPLSLGKQQKHHLLHDLSQAARAEAAPTYPEGTNLGVKPAGSSSRASVCLDVSSMGRAEGAGGCARGVWPPHTVHATACTY